MNQLAIDLQLPDKIKGLSIKQTKFVMGILCHGSIQLAGEEAGITRSTAYKWSNDDKIKKALNQFRDAFVLQSINRNKMFLNTAVDKVFEIMNDDNASKRTQLNAAKTLIELSERLIEKADILDRIDELEKHYEEEFKQ